ncbi:MAG: 50S ribosomal protein L3 [Candidatus Babeliales bacterium]
MVSGIWGCKVGMTQIFTKDKVVPVTIVDVGHWVVTNIKTEKIDGYNALQVACVKKRYRNENFSKDWLKKLKKYFSFIKNISVNENVFSGIVVGQPVDFSSEFIKGKKVDVFGKTKGRGFAGVVKRHNFAGPPKSHGSTMGNRPGSIGFITACGRVIKGKKMPGHLGNQQRAMKNLEIIEMKTDEKVLFIQGSVPGKTGNFIFIRKAENVA